ncbi:MAG: T9SS type A sorting domain-containing protein [Brumimicrobium sp.]|nr:T9SS type A sorting domain-containing protein [Brumimicrobium sp.]
MNKTLQKHSNLWIGSFAKKAIMSFIFILTIGSVSLSQLTITVGSGAATSNYFPLYYLYNYSYSQTIYTADEFTSQGVSGAQLISAIRYKPTSSVSTSNWQDWVVYIGTTSQDGFSGNTDWIAVSSLTEVFNGQIPPNVTANDWLEIQFNSNFLWDGVSNIVIAVDQNTPSWGNTPNWAGYTLAPSTGSKGIYYYSDGTNPDPASPPTASNTTNTVAQIQFDMTPAIACSGQPSAGVVVGPSTFGVCENESFQIQMSGVTNEADVIYQWQGRNAGSTDPWLNAATTPNLNYPPGAFTTDLEFRLWVECTNSGLSDTSDIITVTVKPANQCYCTPPPASTGGLYWIENVSTTGGSINISNLGTGIEPNEYGDYTNMTIQVTPFSDFQFNIDAQSGASPGISIWIDWNQNGVFEAVEEVFSSGAGQSSSLNNYTGTINVPVTAVLGTTRMRIRNYINRTPCDPQSYGEAEDYTVEVLPLSDCTGTPDAGTISDMDVCANKDFIIETVGASAPANGFEFTWQSSSDGTNWNNITGANGYSHNVTGGITSETYYRLIIGCNLTSTADTSNVMSVSLKPANQCYCIPGGTSTSYYINDFSTTGGVQNISNLNTGSDPGGYGDYTATDTVSQNFNQTVNFSAAYGGGTFGTKIWVDWNQDGQFDVNEIAFASNSYVTSQTGSFIVPNDALEGPTRMRVGISYTPNTGPNSPCETGSREFEDYTFIVIPKPACDTTATPADWALKTSMDTICLFADSVGLSIENPIYANDVSYTYQSSTDGINWTNLANPYILNVSTDIYVRAMWACNGNPVDPTQAIHIPVVNPQVLSTTDGERCEDGPVTLSAQTSTNTQALWYDNPGGIGEPIYIGANFTTPSLSQTTSYWVAAANGGNGAGGSLTTITDQGNGCYNGVMFDITPNSNFRLDSIHSFANGSGSVVEVYYIEGTCVGHETNPADWTLLESIPGSYPMGAISIPLTNPLHMNAGQTYGIYLNFYASYTNMPSGTTYSNNDVTIATHFGLCNPFGSTNERAFNGTVFYSNSGCTSNLVEVVATVQDHTYPTSGTGHSINVCRNQPINLYDGLNGVVHMGGVWKDYNNNVTTSQPIASNFPGSFNYMYIVDNGVCPADTAIIEVIVGTCDYLSVGEEVFTQLAVYPNPATTQLTIENPSNMDELIVEMVDMNGRIVLADKNLLSHADKATINISFLEKGIYTLRVFNTEGYRIFKIVKQ